MTQLTTINVTESPTRVSVATTDPPVITQVAPFQPTTLVGESRYDAVSTVVAQGYGDLPPGLHDLSQTILMPVQYGGGWISGVGPISSPQGPTTPFRTVLRPTSPSNFPAAPFIRMRGQGQVLRNFSIWGKRTPTSSRSLATCGVEMSYHASGESAIGQGLAYLENLEISDFPVGFSFGELNSGPTTVNNLDVTSFNKIEFNNCDVGVQLNNNQSVSHTFTHLNWSGSNPSSILFDIRAGGNVDCFHLHLTNTGTAYKINSNGSFVGSNNGVFNIFGGRADNNAVGFRLLDHTPTTGQTGRLDFNCFGFFIADTTLVYQNDDTKCVASIMGEARFNWHGGRVGASVMQNNIFWGHETVGAIPTFTVTDVRVASDPRSLVQTNACTGRVNLIWRGLTQQNGTMIADDSAQWNGSAWV
jgi:hypothetical protein